MRTVIALFLSALTWAAPANAQDARPTNLTFQNVGTRCQIGATGHHSLTATYDPATSNMAVRSFLGEGAAWTPRARVLLVGVQVFNTPLSLPNSHACTLDVIPLVSVPGGAGAAWLWSFPVPPLKSGDQFLMQGILLAAHPDLPPVLASGPHVVATAPTTAISESGGNGSRAVRARLFADGSVSCVGADDHSLPIGSVVLRPVATGISFQVVLTAAAKNWHYYVELSQNGTCQQFQRFTGFTTRANGSGVFRGIYPAAPGSYDILVDVVSDPSSSVPDNPKHREIAPGRLMRISVR